MLVLGFSGLDRSLGLKERLVPGLDDRELRYRQGMDSAAALVSEDGVLAASAQERHDGVKTTGAFPADAIDACLAMAGVTLDDVDFVAHSFCYEPSVIHDLDEFAGRWYREVYSEAVQLEVLRARYPDCDWERKLVRVRHHLAHAASAYYLSGFGEAITLVADGMGETESTSILAGRGDELRPLRSYPISSSLGILYSIVTHYLGFLPGMDEYKVMGLAPYGDRGRFAGVVPDLIKLGAHGQLSVPVLSRDQSPTERETHRGVLNALEDLLGPARHPEAPVEQRHMDVAATLQDCLEASLLHVLAQAGEQLGSANLCMAGGVALNCTANGLIQRSGQFDDIFVQPAAGDDGTALGAALWQLHQQVPVKPARMTMPYWGDSYSDAELAQAVRGLGPEHEVVQLTSDDLTAAVADLIAAGSIVAWFQGRMEFGPRALGNRSILADPTRPDMRAHLNAVVKQREEFRPFAPAVLAEEAGKYFEITPGTERTFEHMLFVADVRAEYRDRLPSITHVDGSARLQIVQRDSAPLFWRLISAAGARLGVPIVLNTSFNLRGQPIIRTPAEAVATYARSAIDALALGNWLITRSPRAAAGAERNGWLPCLTRPRPRAPPPLGMASRGSGRRSWPSPRCATRTTSLARAATPPWRCRSRCACASSCARTWSWTSSTCTRSSASSPWRLPPRSAGRRRRAARAVRRRGADLVRRAGPPPDSRLPHQRPLPFRRQAGRRPAAAGVRGAGGAAQGAAYRLPQAGRGGRAQRGAGAGQAG